MEPLDDCTPTNRQIVELVGVGRETMGWDADVLVDVGHRWKSAKEALRWLQELEQFDPGFIETPLWLDDIAATEGFPSGRRSEPPSASCS